MYFNQILIQVHCLFAGEIERCLKKVTEGVETFEDIWQKVSSLLLLKMLYYIEEYGNINFVLQCCPKNV